MYGTAYFHDLLDICHLSKLTVCGFLLTFALSFSHVELISVLVRE